MLVLTTFLRKGAGYYVMWLDFVNENTGIIQSRNTQHPVSDTTTHLACMSRIHGFSKAAKAALGGKGRWGRPSSTSMIPSLGTGRDLLGAGPLLPGSGVWGQEWFPYPKSRRRSPEASSTLGSSTSKQRDLKGVLCHSCPAKKHSSLYLDRNL